MTPGQAALTFVTLLVIVDPVALAPVFGGLTRDMPESKVRRTAAVAVLGGFALLAVAGVAGHAVLRALGAEMALAHLLVAAALLLMGAAMLLGVGGFGLPGGRGRRDPALVPLAAPLIAGPGALGAMVMFAGRNAGQWSALGTLYALLAAVAALTYLAFRAAEPITARLGGRGVRLITRALGLVLVAASVRFLIDALRDYGLIGGGA
ncbi:MAG: MarC family protein [Rhodobacteraceae bacterium]|nr:MarC family protein [Paracoccaceae bacterium]